MTEKMSWNNRPISIYQNSNMAPGLSTQNCKIPLSGNSHTGYHEMKRRPNIEVSVPRTWYFHGNDLQGRNVFFGNILLFEHAFKS